MTQKETIPLAPTSYMAEFEAELKRSLAELHQQGLRRELRRVDSAQSPHISIKGETLLNFSSNDYLGLANEPLLKEAAVEAVNRYGAGAGGSRLICGSLAPHHKLEEALAEFQQTLKLDPGNKSALEHLEALQLLRGRRH